MNLSSHSKAGASSPHSKRFAMFVALEAERQRLERVRLATACRRCRTRFEVQGFKTRDFICRRRFKVRLNRKTDRG